MKEKNIWLSFLELTTLKRCGYPTGMFINASVQKQPLSLSIQEHGKKTIFDDPVWYERL